MFEVPYETPFIALTEKAFGRLVNEQYEVLQRGIATHKKLERLVVEERGLDEVVRALSAAIGGAVLVLDPRGEPLASRTFRRELPDEAIRAVREQVRAADGSEFAPDHPELAGRSLVLPVSAKAAGAPSAWLVAVRDTDGLGDFERLICQQATTVVALELMRQRAMRDTERRLAGDVIADAVSGRLEGRELAGRLRPFGVGEHAAVVVLSGGTGRARPGARARRTRGAPDWWPPATACWWRWPTATACRPGGPRAGTAPRDRRGPRGGEPGGRGRRPAPLLPRGAAGARGRTR